MKKAVIHDKRITNNSPLIAVILSLKMRINTLSFVFECGEKSLLDNELVVKDLLYEMVALAKLTPLEYISHKFQPQGVSATLILSESHIAIHTWPEKGSGYIILTSCVQQDGTYIAAATESIAQALRVRLSTAKEIT